MIEISKSKGKAEGKAEEEWKEERKEEWKEKRKVKWKNGLISHGRLKKAGFPDQVIADNTGLSLEQIKQL